MEFYSKLFNLINNKSLSLPNFTSELYTISKVTCSCFGSTKKKAIIRSPFRKKMTNHLKYSLLITPTQLWLNFMCVPFVEYVQQGSSKWLLRSTTIRPSTPEVSRKTIPFNIFFSFLMSAGRLHKLCRRRKDGISFVSSGYYVLYVREKTCLFNGLLRKIT